MSFKNFCEELRAASELAQNLKRTDDVNGEVKSSLSTPAKAAEVDDFLDLLLAGVNVGEVLQEFLENQAKGNNDPVAPNSSDLLDAIKRGKELKKVPVRDRPVSDSKRTSTTPAPASASVFSLLGPALKNKFASANLGSGFGSGSGSDSDSEWDSGFSDSKHSPSSRRR